MEIIFHNYLEIHQRGNLDKCLSHMGDRFVISFVGVDVFNVII